MIVNKIEKDTYIKIVKDKLLNISFEDTTKILNNLIEKLPSELYDVSLCIIDDVLGNSDISLEEINSKYQELKEIFELINNGELTFKSYSYSTGYYSYYEEEYGYEYYDDENISKLLKETLDFGIYLVNKKNYNLAQKVFELIIYTNYSCGETSDPDYDCGDEEIFYCYDIDLKQVEGLLSFDLKKIYSYAIYTAYFCNDRYKKIYGYLSCCKNIKFEECTNLGIEKMVNLDNFYQNWIEFLTNVNNSFAEELIKEAMLYTNVDEYMICKKSFKNHPNLYKEYLLKLLSENKFNKIIETYEEAINEITDLKIKRDISYITIDAINYGKSNLDKSKYYYCIFDSLKNICDFLIILNNNLYNDEIKKYVDKLSYNNELSYLTDKSYYDFFLGNFEKIYINKFNDEVAMEDEILYLMMLYLSDTKVMTRIKDKILCYLTRNFDEYNYRNLNIDINNKSLSLLEKLDNWKQNIQINEELKNQFINKLELINERKITYILENKYRNRYSEAAIFVVMLDEVLTNNKYINKDEYISKIDKKYVRFNLFRKEIKNYKEIK